MFECLTVCEALAAATREMLTGWIVHWMPTEMEDRARVVNLVHGLEANESRGHELLSQKS